MFTLITELFKTEFVFSILKVKVFFYGLIPQTLLSVLSAVTVEFWFSFTKILLCFCVLNFTLFFPQKWEDVNLKKYRDQKLQMEKVRKEKDRGGQVEQNPES